MDHTRGITTDETRDRFDKGCLDMDRTRGITILGAWTWTTRGE